MTAGDLAAVLVTLVVFAAFVVLLLVTQGLLRALRDLRRSLGELRRETVPLLAELRQTVASAGAEVERVDDLLDAAETISATVESVSRLSYLAFRAPVIKTVAFWRGIGRFLRRLTGGGAAAEHRRAERRAARRGASGPGRPVRRAGAGSDRVDKGRAA